MIEQLHRDFLQYLSSQKAHYRRYIWKRISHRDKLIGITGARGVGKTTYILQYLQSLDLPLHKKLYISADNIDVLESSLLEIARVFSSQGGAVLAIDEIHKYKHFERELKQITDMLDLHVIFSGSSALELENAQADLSRRAVVYRMNGLSYREFLEIRLGMELPTFALEEILEEHVEIANALRQTFKPLEHWKTYLRSGYYPFYFEEESTYSLKLNATINTVIETDIPAVYRIRYESIIKLKKLITLLCRSEPFKINIQELSSRIGTDRDTLYQYLHYLDRGRILSLLRSRARGDAIFSKPDKVYLDNPNLYHAYCHQAKIGTIRESFFVSQMKLDHDVSIPGKGDFMIDEKWVFEIGGKNKSFEQIKDLPDSLIAADEIEVGFGRKIPLWLFGFLY